MAAYNKFNQYVEDVSKGVHDLSTDTLKVMLTNVAPVATNTVKSNLTEIAAGNGYSAGGNTVTVTTSGQTGGTFTLDGDNVVFTASGGAIATFQYAVLYNDTPASPLDPLIGWWNNGTPINLADGESCTITFDGVNGIFTLS